MTYDCFTFFNELDLLEIRLNILDKHADKFIIVESLETFSGKEKPLYFGKNQERFAKWQDKIIHVVVGTKEFPNAFERAAYQKDMVRKALEDAGAKDDDIVYFGDLDEIWMPVPLPENKVYNLAQLNYCYFLNNRSSERWVGTFVGRWGLVKTQSVSHWRATHTYEVSPGGWHFTNMGGADQIRRKLDAYDHQEFNNDDVKTDIEFNMHHGFDYVGRQRDWEGMPFEMWIDDIDLPQFVKDNREVYKHLWK